MSGRAAHGTVREARDGAAEFVAPALGFGFIVAPSHHAALHFSVQDAVRNLPVERRPHVAVVNPGIDATIYGNVERAACR